MSSRIEHGTCRGTTGFWAVAMIVALASWAASSTSVANAAAGICVRVEVDGPIVLPDGSARDAGTLRICERRSFTPVASLHATYVGGEPVGLLVSRRSTSEGTNREAPTILFERDASGRMRLLGYVLPHAGTSVSYTLAKPSVRSVRSPLTDAPVVALVAR